MSFQNVLKDNGQYRQIESKCAGISLDRKCQIVKVLILFLNKKIDHDAQVG